MPYNPAIHHRRSIRMRGWDYARGAYFITICAHRDAGAIFAAAAAIVARIWESIPARFPSVTVGEGLVPAPLQASVPGGHAALPGGHAALSGGHAALSGGHAALSGDEKEGNGEEGNHKGCPYVVMPDHFHGIVGMGGSGRKSGDIIGAFKSLVAHELIAEIKARRLSPFPGKIWQRNYYERIIRSDREMASVIRYIRQNPWRVPVCIGRVPDDKTPLRAIGNPQLLQRHITGVLCSRRCPADAAARPREKFRDMAGNDSARDAVISGFHSAMEKECLAMLLSGKTAFIVCLPHTIEHWRVPPDWICALEQNRMLIISPFRNNTITRGDAMDRNKLVLHFSNDLFVPFVAPGGGLAGLLRKQKGKTNEYT